jgi:hypothetical protein
MMRLVLLLLLLPLTLLAAIPEAQPEGWSVSGHVLAVKADGILVSCVSDEKVGMKPKDGEVVFVKGKFAFAEGAAVNLTCEPAGTYKCQLPGKGESIVLAFQSRN